jgi:polyisoprenoid-binding protein YceI
MTRLLLILASALLSTQALASDWRAGSARSLSFTGAYMGESFDGRFERFDPLIRFDPAALENARFEVQIDMLSARTGNEEYDSTMHGEEFFDSRNFQQALFVAKTFRSTGDNTFEADGELTLHGKTVRVPFPFSFQIDGDTAHLKASVTLKRLDFDIGTGDWADTDLIANEVQVNVDLPLNR